MKENEILTIIATEKASKSYKIYKMTESVNSRILLVSKITLSTDKNYKEMRGNNIL